MKLFLFLSLLLSPAALASGGDPELTLASGSQSLTFKRSELLKRKDLETLTIDADPAYPGQKMVYKAVPAAALFEGLKIADDAVIQFKCLDGFSAPISKDRLLNKAKDKSLAYVAIEDADQPWPQLKPDSPSAGPFYLVWPNPKASFIGPEEWPFHLAAFEVKGTLESLYPGIFPAKDVKANDPVRRGLAMFTKHCFACHTLNKQGAAEVGPDLNVPMSPTEYLQKAALRQQIRDPQSLRYFPKSRMSAFPASILSDKELDDLVAYLTYMSKHKLTK